MMKYIGMPAGEWLMFSGSFREQLSKTLGSGGPYCDCGYKKKAREV